MRSHLAVAVLLTTLAAPAAAAPPTLTYLFPAGAQRGTTVDVTAGGTFDRWPLQAWVQGAGVTVQAAKEKGKLTVTVAADAVPGTYWLRLYDEQGASSLRSFVVGTLPEVAEREPNDDPRKPQALDTSTVTVNGRLGRVGDVDSFAVPLRKGQTLVASLEANRLLGSPMDAILQVLSADGFVLDQNNDYHDLDPQIVFSAPADGTYVVRTFAFPSTPDSSIRFTGSDACIYRLTLTTGGFVDHAFPLAISRGQRGPVEAAGWNIPAEMGKLFAHTGDDPEAAWLFHPLLANTAPVRLEPHPTTVRAEDNDAKHPQALELPVTVSGRLRPGFPDVYRFEAKKDQKLFFQVESRALGFPLDAVLHLTDAAGKTLARVDDPRGGRGDGVRDPSLAFTVPADGTYRLEVHDLHGGGGFRYVYRLRAVHAVPDFELALATDRFVASPGKPLDIPVTVTRQNGPGGEIEITAEGLPAGVSAVPVRSLPTGPTAKAVTLRLTAETDPVSFPIRVVGKVAGGEESTRTARAPIADLTASTCRPWVTVLKPGQEAEKPPEPKKKKR
jgi:hypothetical protein